MLTFSFGGIEKKKKKTCKWQKLKTRYGKEMENCLHCAGSKCLNMFSLFVKDRERKAEKKNWEISNSLLRLPPKIPGTL